MRRASVRRFELWGTGRGPLARRAPEVRLLAGACMATCCLVAPLGSPAGIAFAALTVTGWVLICGVPFKQLVSWVVLGGVMLGPLWVLTPWVTAQQPPLGAAPPAGLDHRLWLVGTIVARGVATMVVTLSTMATLERWDWHEGLARLPMPAVLRALLVQLVHQTGLLLAETRRIVAAMAVRGGTARLRFALGLIVALPSVWLPRVMDRAERTAAAMDLRGLGTQVPRFRVVAPSWRDPATILAALGWLAAAISLHFWLLR